jgi:hypothetical protein
LKIIFIVDDEEGLKNVYPQFLGMFFPASEYLVVVIDTFAAGMEYGLTHLSEIKIAILDGRLDEKKLSYPIALAMKEAGYKGNFILVSGNDLETVVPHEEYWPLFTHVGKPILDAKRFAAQIKEKILD